MGFNLKVPFYAPALHLFLAQFHHDTPIRLVYVNHFLLHSQAKFSSSNFPFLCLATIPVQVAMTGL
jgi:hypothetical protein